MGFVKSKPADKTLRKGTSVLVGRKYEPKILIIGAGAAGLACGRRLLENNFLNVLVLEAEERIGGRIYTVPFGDNMVDLGAQFCHGQYKNVVYNMVNGLELLDSSAAIYDDFQCIRSNGEVVPDELVSRLKLIMIDIFLTQKQNMASYRGSFDNYLKTSFFAKLNSEENNDIDKDIANEFLTNYDKMENTEVSAIGMAEYGVCDGDYMMNWKTKGFKEFLAVLTGADEIGNNLGLLEDKIKFNMVVETIKWDRPDGLIEVKCVGKDECFIADHVIVTCPLGVLKVKHEELFKPVLPEWKRHAIEKLGYGYVCKTYLEFSAPFWPKDWNGLATLWLEEDQKKLAGTSWAWVLEIFGFYCVSYQPRVLIGWIVGPCGNQVETLPTETVRIGCMSVLRRFLKNWKEIPEPINIVVSKWTTNPNFSGAYSYRSVAAEVTHITPFMLAQPLTSLVYDVNTIAIDPNGVEVSQDPIRPKTVKPLLQFAGEATNDKFLSTVHGAVESGYREADRLVGFYLKQI